MAGLATLTDRNNYGIARTAFGQLSDPQLQAQLDSASAWANSKMAARYSMPLLAWDISITQAVVQIADYQALVQRGFDPNNPGDAAARDLWLAAREFFNAVERQHAHPLVTESPLPTNQAQPSVAAPMVMGQPLLGWMPGQESLPSTGGSPLNPGSGFPAGAPWPPTGWPDGTNNPPPGVF